MTRIPAQCPPDFPSHYTVQPGDSMWLIAQRFGVSSAALIASNRHITSPNLIIPGDVLCVPDSDKTRQPSELPAPPTGKGITVFHVIRENQTMQKLVGLYRIPLDRLIEANPDIIDPEVLHTGQVVRIPVTPPILPPVQRLFFEYVVQPVDTISAIADRFQITVDAVLSSNPLLVDPDLIFVGQLLYIPVVVQPLPAPVPAILYVVQPVDTLSGIATKFGVSLENLIVANPQIPDPDLIIAFEIIVVPVEEVPEPPVFRQRRYVVQRNDTLEEIAGRFGVTVGGIIATNLFPEAIPGLILIIPAVIPSPQAVATARVALGIWDRKTAIIMVAIAGAESAWEPTIGGDTPRTLFELESVFAPDALRFNCPLGNMDGPASWGLWQIFMPLHAQILINDKLVPSENSLLGRLGAPVDDPCKTAEWLRKSVNNAQAAAAILELLGFQAWTAFVIGAFKNFLPEAEAAVQAVEPSKNSENSGTH